MSRKVLITGGTGKTGRRLAERLAEAGVAHRVGSRRGSPPFDWGVPATWDAALEGIDALYLLAPPTLPDPVGPMIAFAKLAAALGVNRFVLLSYSPIPAGGPQLGQVHQWLMGNASDWAVLRPTWFMQNFSEGQHLATIRDEDAIYSATGSGRTPFISADDIASAASAALLAETPLNQDYILTNDALLSYDQVAAIIGDAVGRSIRHRAISAEALTERFRARGLPDAYAATAARMDQMIAGGAEDRTTDALRQLTGQAPVDFAAFAKTNAATWAKKGPA